jgi:hypothetical protein
MEFGHGFFSTHLHPQLAGCITASAFYHGFAKKRVRRRFLDLNVSAAKVTPCRAQRIAREPRLYCARHRHIAVQEQRQITWTKHCVFGGNNGYVTLREIGSDILQGRRTSQAIYRFLRCCGEKTAHLYAVVERRLLTFTTATRQWHACRYYFLTKWFVYGLVVI